MSYKFSISLILLLFPILALNYASAKAEENIFFRPLLKKEENIAEILLSKDYFGFEENRKKEFIHFPQDVKIALVDLNDDGEKEILLYMHAGTACGTAGCDLLIWQKKKETWKNIGWEKAYNNSIILLDKTNSSFHQILSGNKVLRWKHGSY